MLAAWVSCWRRRTLACRSAAYARRTACARPAPCAACFSRIRPRARSSWRSFERENSVVATFCLRLAAGLILMLPILPASQIPPRFFRVHFLTALGLLALAGVFIGGIATIAFWLLFAVGMAACLLG